MSISGFFYIFFAMNLTYIGICCAKDVEFTDKWFTPIPPHDATSTRNRQDCNNTPKDEMLRLTVCEGKRMILKCEEPRYISVCRVIYGRFDIKTCPHSQSSRFAPKTNCYSSRAVSLAPRRCDNKTSCELWANNTYFNDDPCIGTEKYLKVEYFCAPVPRPTLLSDIDVRLPSLAHNSNYSNESDFNDKNLISIVQRVVSMPKLTSKNTIGFYKTIISKHTGGDNTFHTSPDKNDLGLRNGSLFVPGRALSSAGVEGNDGPFGPPFIPKWTTPNPRELKDVCPISEDRRGLAWAASSVGVHNQDCLGGFSGVVARECRGRKNRPPKWAPSDYSSCVSKEIKQISDDLKSPDVNLSSVVTKIKNLQKKEQKPLSTGDILEVTNQIVPTVTQRNKQGQSSANRITIAKAIVNASSDVLDSRQKPAWAELPTERQHVSAQNIMASIENVGSQVAAALSEEIDLGDDVSERDILITENIVLEVAVVNSSKKVSASLKEDIIQLPSAAEIANTSWHDLSEQVLVNRRSLKKLKNEYSVNDELQSIVFVAYRNLQQYLDKAHGYSLFSNESSATELLNSHIVSASIASQKEAITPMDPPVLITFKNLNESLLSDMVPRCSYWNFTKDPKLGHWAFKGCRVVVFNSSITQCECDHLTNFAVLMTVEPATQPHTQHALVLSFITYIGCGISLIFLFCSFWMFHLIFRYAPRPPNLKSFQQRNVILKNLVFCLFVAELIFVLGISQHENKVLCGVVAGALHYFFLAAFFWMCMLGSWLYLLMYQVFSEGQHRIPIYYIISYCCPGIIVLVTGLISGGNSYGTNQHCWMQIDGGYSWAFVGPVLVIIFLNLLMLALMLKKMWELQSNERCSGLKCDESSSFTIKQQLVTAVGFGTVMGLTWLFGLLYIDSSTLVFAYIFTILNSLQGLFIFLFYCVLDKRARKARENFVEKNPGVPFFIRFLLTGRCTAPVNRSSSFLVKDANNFSGSGNYLQRLLQNKLPTRWRRSTLTSSLKSSSSNKPKVRLCKVLKTPNGQNEYRPETPQQYFHTIMSETDGDSLLPLSPRVVSFLPQSPPPQYPEPDNGYESWSEGPNGYHPVRTVANNNVGASNNVFRYSAISELEFCYSEIDDDELIEMTTPAKRPKSTTTPVGNGILKSPPYSHEVRSRREADCHFTPNLNIISTGSNQHGDNSVNCVPTPNGEVLKRKFVEKLEPLMECSGMGCLDHVNVNGSSQASAPVDSCECSSGYQTDCKCSQLKCSDLKQGNTDLKRINCSVGSSDSNPGSVSKNLTATKQTPILFTYNNVRL